MFSEIFSTKSSRVISIWFVSSIAIGGVSNETVKDSICSLSSSAVASGTIVASVVRVPSSTDFRVGNVSPVAAGSVTVSLTGCSLAPVIP